jgi:Helix-turn-helix domain
MSIKIMSWVLDHSPYEGKARLIHVVLADHANDEGVCWPRQDQIAKRAGCSVEHVRMTVKQMVADGYVELVSASKGRGSSHRYLLKSPKSVGVVEDLSPQVDGLSPQVDGAITPNPSPNNRQEPSITISKPTCPYCQRTFMSGKPHNCSAMNQLIR